MDMLEREHKELKTLKSSLNENEIILQSDFSENYTNIQQNAIQSCYFGCESFALYTACAWHTKGAELVCDNFVIVSDQLDHSKHLVLKANMLLLNLLQERVPELKAIHFWSDGCGKQFKSKYCFHLLTKYPANIKVKWNYFESHHGKGPVDGVGGHVKLRVYRDVKAGKVVIKDAKHFAEYAHGTIKNINVIYLDKEDIPVVSVNDSLDVIGTLQIHSVEREVNDTEIHLKFYKNSQYDDVHDLPFRSIIYNHEANDPQPSNPEKSLDEKQDPCHEVTPIQQELLSKVSDVSSLSPSCNLAVLYEGDWWLGQVKEVSVENDDVHISFLHPKGPNNTFFWPSPEDNCWIPINDILGQLVHPVLPISSRKVGIANDIVDIINDQFRVRFQ